VVEAAFVLPAVIFLLLLTIQLTQIQQARIMSEYAAFSAARAGIVHDGDPSRMQAAAEISILPTWGRADSWGHMVATLAKFRAEDVILRPFGLGQVRIYVHNPVAADFRAFGQHLNGQEIDFDDVRPAAAEATLLSLQVRYLYEMRVPFANKLIQTIWMASKAGLLRSWGGFDWTGPKLGPANGPDAVRISRAIAAARTVPDGTPEGIRLGGLVAAGAAGRDLPRGGAFLTMGMQ